jgi:hypothetical protein
MRTPAAVDALAGFIQANHPGTPDLHLAIAALGLGRTRDEAMLRRLLRVSNRVDSRRAKAMVAAARCLCGDEEAAQYLLDVLDNPDASRELRMDVIPLVEECRPEGAVALLGQLARAHADDEFGTRAFGALLVTSGYLSPGVVEMIPGPEEQQDTEDPEDADEEDTEEPMEQRWEEGDEMERRALVDEVVRWHEAHPQAGGPEVPPEEPLEH